MKNHGIEQPEVESIVHGINFRRKERAKIFLGLPVETRATVLLHLNKNIRFLLVKDISDEDLVGVLEFLDPDEATDIIQLLPGSRQKRIVRRLSDDLQRSVQILTKFDPKTAAGLMNIDYIQAEESDTIAAVIKKFRDHEMRTGRLPAVIATRDGKVRGYIPGHTLGMARPSESAKKYIRRISRIRYSASHDDVARVFKEHPHNKVTVVGDRDNVIGVIYSDDILRVMKEQESSSLYDFAGVNVEESVTDSVSSKVRFRCRWLIVNLATAFLAAFTVSLFEDTISKYVLLAVYMPIVAGMGGNAGTQTLAVLVRGIAFRQISLKHAWPTIAREVGAALINGLINGLIVAAVVITVNRDIKIAIILGSAMIINLMVAGFFGTLVPLIMHKLGKDPASSATIFITTATDVLGFLAFLGLASLILL